MEAFILLLISIFLLSIYGFIYVSHRLLGKVRQNERSQFKRSFVVLLFVILLSGSSVAMIMLI